MILVWYYIITSQARAVAGCEVLWWVGLCLSVCMSVCLCLSVCPRGYLRKHTCDLYQTFCACRLCPWLGPFRHVYDKPHRLSPGKGFLPRWKCIIGPERGMGAHSACEVCYLRWSRFLNAFCLPTLICECEAVCISNANLRTQSEH